MVTHWRITSRNPQTRRTARTNDDDFWRRFCPTELLWTFDCRTHVLFDVILPCVDRRSGDRPGRAVVQVALAMIRVDSMLPAIRQRRLIIGHGQQLTEAAALLSDDARHMAVVCDADDRMVGVVTRTDIVRQIQHCQGCACTTMCADVMTKEVVTCAPDQMLEDVWLAMKQNRLLCVPVVDAERRPLGLLFASDALEALLSEVEYEEELLKDYVMCVGYR